MKARGVYLGAPHAAWLAEVAPVPLVGIWRGSGATAAPTAKYAQSDNPSRSDARVPRHNTSGRVKDRVSQGLAGGKRRRRRNLYRPGLAFERFQIGDQVADLILVKREFGHSGMPSPDTLGKRLLEILDGISLMKGSEGRCFR